MLGEVGATFVDTLMMIMLMLQVEIQVWQRTRTALLLQPLWKQLDG
jgi:hypothetical protein